MTVYKVVRESWTESGRYYSALVDGQALMVYRIGAVAQVPDWLADRGYYATAFATLEDAQQFAKEAVPHPQIFEADAEACVDLPPRAAIFDVVHGQLGSALSVDWPAGTVMVTSLRLTGKIP